MNAPMTPPPTRFVRVVGGLFLVAGALCLLISGAQVVLLSSAAPGGFVVDGTARAVALGLVASSAVVIITSVAFLRRRRWARPALAAIAALGIVGNLLHLLVRGPAIEPPPPDVPADYVRLLRLISIADVVVPIAVCLAFGWILWRLRSVAVRDQFR
jgi:hypothetical protein